MNKIAVIGVSGMVGRAMLEILEERNFPVGKLLPAASAQSAGKSVSFRGRKHKIMSITEALAQDPDIALFSAGSAVSLQWAPLFAEKGCMVIDNSSAWRMDGDVPLVIPEINISSITAGKRIIANPNCSTIQLLMVMAPLHRAFGIKRMLISTYQSVTGTGKKAVEQLDNEIKGIQGEMAYPHPIFMNCLPHCDTFLDNGYTREEMKLLNETMKILDDTSIKISATAVRVPVLGGHSESVNAEFSKAFELEELLSILRETEGVVVRDKPDENIYPMPRDARGKDEVFVGRIRRDLSCDNALNMWIVADNIRKGAATNAIQIAEHLI